MKLKSWLNSLKCKTKRSRGVAQVAGVPQAAETMESRQLLSVSALFIPATGELNIQLDGQDSVRVSAAAGNVLVEVSTSGGGFTPVSSIGNVAASNVQSIVILGSDEANSIDLSGVTAAAFTANPTIEVDGANGDDTLLGSPDLADSLIGGDGNDSINGQGGNDTIVGGNGGDSITAGAGDDSIRSGDGQDSITGDAGNDTIDSGDGDDMISCGDGNDSVFAGNGQDSINGDLGDDTLNGDGGTDTVSGDAGNDSILGGEFGDSLLGGDGNDTINGQGGNDTIDGEAGDDSLLGAVGNDSLLGGDGNDLSNGNSGNDTIEGGNGNDLLYGGTGNDVIFDDFQLAANSFTGADTLLGQGGNDTLIAVGGPDSLDGGVGNDLLSTRLSGLIIDDLRFNEGNVTNTVTFNVRLTSPSFMAVSVDFATFSDGTTAGGTATAGNDYQSTNGTLTFAPGESLKTINVVILGDTTLEGDETFFVNLSNVVNAQINDPQAEGRILNDDVAAPQVLDIVLLFDDTGNFSSAGPTLASSFNSVITQLQAQFSNGDFAFGISRFEDYALGQNNDRPFILNQPVITDDTVNFNTAITAALNRSSPGGGGPRSESDIEALFQLATGTGFDGNNDGDTTDSGPAGLASTQTNPGRGGDVPAYSSFTPDLANNVLPPTIPVASSIDGIGFRPGARHIVLIATDAPFTFRPDGLAVYTGVGGVTVPASQVTLNGGASAPPNGALIQNTINQLIARNIEVIGLGDQDSRGANGDPRPQLEGVSILTGGINNATAAIENGITPGPSADDIQPGQPLFFRINPSDATGLANAIVLGITGVVGVVIPPPPPPPPTPPPLSGPQNDTLIGSDGDDTLLAGDFDDFINAGAGNDSVDGGGGNDSVLGGAGADTINGGTGDDTLNGQGGSDILLGADGDDTILFDGSGGPTDSADGGDGFNTIQVSGTAAADVITVGQLGGVLVVGIGGGTISATSNIQCVLVDGANGNDIITIGSIDTVAALKLDVRGGTGNDLLDATGANIGRVRMSLSGNAGNDTLNGSLGNDTLDGGSGDDSCCGFAGNDTIIGGTGNDSLGGSLGNDSINGGDGADSINGQQGDDRVDGGLGNDTLKGDDGNDTLLGGVGDDNLNGMAGNDSILGGVGADAVVGGNGNDTLDGGRNNDTISGNAGDDKIRGDHGNDYINAGDGSNTVNGGDGDDTIVSGLGNDFIHGGDGNDLINSDDGDDIVVGGDGNDTILSGGGQDIILGGDGDDSLNGQGGTDTIAGQQGNDVIVDPVAEIHEAFTLSAAIIAILNAL